MRKVPCFSPVSPDQVRLELCYRATIYRVYADHGEVLDLRIGRHCAALEALLARNACLSGDGNRCWAILTACNPASRRLSEEENAHRQRLLGQTLAGLGYSTLDAVNLVDVPHGENDGGRGGDAATGWPPEAAHFVLFLPLPQAFALAEDFGQNALVYGGGERGDGAGYEEAGGKTKESAKESSGADWAVPRLCWIPPS